MRAEDLQVWESCPESNIGSWNYGYSNVFMCQANFTAQPDQIIIRPSPGLGCLKFRDPAHLRLARRETGREKGRRAREIGSGAGGGRAAKAVKTNDEEIEGRRRKADSKTRSKSSFYNLYLYCVCVSTRGQSVHRYCFRSMAYVQF